jgi:hypothetical protein
MLIGCPTARRFLVTGALAFAVAVPTGAMAQHNHHHSSSSSVEEQNATTSTNNTVLRTEVGATIRGIGAGVSRATGQSRSQRASDPEIVTGLSAGDPFDGQFSTWGSLSATRVKQGGPATAFKGRLYGALLGADLAWDGMVAGVAVGVSRASVDTDFNNGKLSSTSYTVAPYVGMSLTDWLTIDGNIGVGRSTKNTSRNFGAVQGDTVGTRVFLGTNLTAYHDIDQYRLQASVGYTYAIERTLDFQESNNAPVASDISRIGTVTIGGRVGYEFQTITPYISGRLLRDVQKSVAATLTPAQRDVLDDKTAMEIGVGFDMIGEQYVLTGEINKELARDEFDSVTALISLRYRF